jgi:kynureninase
VPHGYEVAQELLSREILIDYRVGAGIRAAPYFFNTDQEIETLIDAIDETLTESLWERHAQRHPVVT